jgi:hypothetical protein
VTRWPCEMLGMSYSIPKDPETAEAEPRIYSPLFPIPLTGEVLKWNQELVGNGRVGRAISGSKNRWYGLLRDTLAQEDTFLQKKKISDYRSICRDINLTPSQIDLKPSNLCLNVSRAMFQ